MKVIDFKDNDFSTMRTFLFENGLTGRSVVREPLIYDPDTGTLHITRYIKDVNGHFQVRGDGFSPPGRYIVMTRERVHCPSSPESCGIRFSS